MEINITWNICRVCLVEEQKSKMDVVVEPMRHIFNDADKMLPNQIYECSGIKMKSNDKLPEKICKKCFVMLKYAVNFRKTCRASDAYLNSILQRTKSASTLFKPGAPLAEDAAEEYICNDYVSNDGTESPIGEMETSKAVEQSNPKAIHLGKASNKLIDKVAAEIDSNTKNEAELADATNVNENDYIVEEDEILEYSEPCVKDIPSNPGDNDGLDKILLDDNKNTHSDTESNTSHVQELEANEITSENDVDFDDEQETNFNDLKGNSIYYLKNDGRKNFSHAKVNRKNLDNAYMEIVEKEDENFEFMSLEEFNMENTEVSVFSKEIGDDILEQQEEGSVSSSGEHVDTENEYVVDEYLIEENSSSDTSQQNVNVRINAKPQKSSISKQQLEKSISNTKPKTSSKTGAKTQLWICNLCGNHFSNRPLLNFHMKIHRQEKKHECELCFKRFITACNLQAHMRTHTGEKPFECQYCGRRFSDRSSNLRHERIHTNEKPFHCQECGKSFSLATTLKKHQKVHTNERLYRCDICAKSFKLSHQLKAHTKSSQHKKMEAVLN